MRSSWPYIALTVVSLAVGGAAGWTLHAPPPPEVREEAKSKADLGIKEASSESAKANTEIAQSIGPTETKRKVTRYHPPAAPPACTNGAVPCNCPGPGPVAEVEEETINAGPGSILISKTQESTAASSRELHLMQELETLRLQRPAKLSRFTGGGGVAVPLWNPSDVAPVASLSVRLFGLTARAALKLPPMRPKESELIVTAEVPL